MGNKNSGQNFPRPSSRHQEESEAKYNSSGYYRNNRELSNSRYAAANSKYNEGSYEDLNASYNDVNTGKYENYNGSGYYGSNYGSINNLNTGRDYEQNAGYRDNYNRLTTGQWPEIERSQQSRYGRTQQHNLPPQGLHKGKGPRSYQRSDMRIKEDINDLLYEDPYVDASDIEVNVENGEVTLTGTVNDRNVKRRTEDIIEQVSGVKHLENRLRPRKPGGEIVNIQNK